MSDIKTIGIVGGGKMGSGIFNRLSQSKHKLIWYIRNDSERPLRKYKRKLDRALKCDLITQEQFLFKEEHHQITDKIDTLKHCDIVIESIVENIEIKKELISTIFQIIGENAIVATNSSSILPCQLTNDPELQKRTIGLHFFYPVEFKNIVELIVGEETDKSLNLKFATEILKESKQLILQQHSKNAFLLNRLMLHLQIKAFTLLKHGFTVKEIDVATDKYLFPGGIFSMMDHIGLDILQTSVNNYSKMADCFEGIGEFMQLLDEKVEEGQLGIKTNMGFHNYLLVEEKVEYASDKLTNIAKQLFSAYREAFDYYIEQNYCTADTLTSAMSEYVDADVDEWGKVI